MVVTPRNKKPAKSAWVESMPEKVIPKSVRFKHDQPNTFVKAIQDEVVQVTGNKVFLPVKAGPTEIRSAKVNKPGTVLTECKAFEKKLKTGKRATLEWWKCYTESCALYHIFFTKCYLTCMIKEGKTMSGRCNAGNTTTSTRG